MKAKHSRRLKSIKKPLEEEHTLIVSDPELLRIEGRMSKFNEHITRISEMVSSMEDSRNSKKGYDVQSEVK